MPIASAMVLMVLAVNMAPQVPLPGSTLRSSASISSAVMRPASRAARPSAQSMMVRLVPFLAHFSMAGDPKSTLPGELVPG